MIKQASTAFLVSVFGLMTACGDGSGHGELGTDVIASPEGFPFVRAAVIVSDLCDGTPAQSCALARNPPRGATRVSISQPEPGKLCAQGTVGAGGYAFIVFVFTEYDGIGNQNISKVLSTFDADALDITQMAFSVDSPPSSGIRVDATTVKQWECPGDGRNCRWSGYRLMTSPTSNERLSITTPEPQVAPFANFVQTELNQSSTFDTSALDAALYWVEPGAFDFCIHDFKFLDAEGAEVLPPS